MRCYRCNSQLTDSDYCLKCGADVSVYKVVVNASNTYYNQGLAKAKVRDLTGAVSCLKTSLSINKNNIKARNLLGLVYFEMGEVVMALSEWVLSKNIKPERNIAETYISRVQANPNKLDLMNQAVRRFNIALKAAKSGSTDMALIQLKKVVNMNPHYVKAGLVLGLIYINDGQKDKALKILNKVLKTDRNNTLALKYIAEINGENADKEESDGTFLKRKGKAKDNSNVAVAGHDVIIPPNSYKEPSNGVFTVLSILLGVIIGAAMVWYLVLPARLANVNHDNNQIIRQYSEQLAANSVDIANLKSQLEDLITERDTLSRQLSVYTGDTGEINMYSMLIDAVGAYVDYDFARAMVLLEEIDIALLPTQNAKDVYTTMMGYCSGGADRFQAQGIKAYLEKDYISAVNYLQAALIYDKTNDEAAFYLGLCYEENDENTSEEAAEYYEEFLIDFPGSAYENEVRTRLDNINAVLNPPQAETETSTEQTESSEQQNQ